MNLFKTYIWFPLNRYNNIYNYNDFLFKLMYFFTREYHLERLYMWCVGVLHSSNTHDFKNSRHGI